MSEKKPPTRVLFRLIKGFAYGNVIGLIFGIAIYLLAAAVDYIAKFITWAITVLGGQEEAFIVGIPIPPVIFLILIWAVSVVAGTAHEYSKWLEGREEV